MVQNRNNCIFKSTGRQPHLEICPCVHQQVIHFLLKTNCSRPLTFCEVPDGPHFDQILRSRNWNWSRNRRPGRSPNSWPGPHFDQFRAFFRCKASFRVPSTVGLWFTNGFPGTPFLVHFFSRFGTVSNLQGIKGNRQQPPPDPAPSIQLVGVEKDKMCFWGEISLRNSESTWNTTPTVAWKL